MKKRLLLLFLPLLFLLPLLCPVTAHAAGGVRAVLYDEGGRLDKKEYDECLARLQKAADKTNMNVGVVLGVQQRSDLTIESVAKNSYTELFGNQSNGLLYYMDLKGNSPYDYIATRGMAQFFYTNSSQHNRIDDIFTAVDPYLYPVGSEDISGAVMQFAEEVEFYFDAGIPDRYYYYDDETRLYYSIGPDGNVRTSTGKPYLDYGTIIGTVILFSFLGLITALFFFFITKARYKFKYSLSPTNYVNRKNVEFYNQYDNHVHTHTSKVSLSSESSGSRSGSGHHHSGGHSHGGFGGGGHHR